MDFCFESIVAQTLNHEGGYVNDSHDPGGETNFGISKRAYPNLAIKTLTRVEAVAIYRRDYWEKPGLNLIKNRPLAAKVFDFGVNAGVTRSIKTLQTAANYFNAGLACDGVLGPQTLKFVNNFKQQTALFMAFKLVAGAHYLKLNQPRYLAGWLNRLAA